MSNRSVTEKAAEAEKVLFASSRIEIHEDIQFGLILVDCVADLDALAASLRADLSVLQDETYIDVLDQVTAMAGTLDKIYDMLRRSQVYMKKTGDRITKLEEELKDMKSSYIARMARELETHNRLDQEVGVLRVRLANIEERLDERG